MKYPTTILAGDHAVGRCISIATANTGVIQDAGAKMIHLGKNTRSQILSKSIALKGGNASYRGLVKITKNAQHSHSDIVCDSIILDQKSKSDAIPTELIENNTSFIKHEARISDLDKETLFYLNAHGVNDQQARQLMVIGFMEPFLLELPLEYAVELNRLIKAYLV
jgi:Fe-S cluster assembly protein SufB